MSDTLSKEQRHANMAAIRAKDTKPEIVVRKFLWKHGFRYRLNHKRLPGKPDVVLRKYRTCIFVNGCFWHGHQLAFSEEFQVSGFKSQDSSRFQEIENSACCKIPHTNREFWVNKIMRNKERDTEVARKLAEMGWHSITIWECELMPAKRDNTLQSLLYTLSKIFLEDQKVKRYDYSDPDPDRMVADESQNESQNATAFFCR